jgi:hypothetical protein
MPSATAPAPVAIPGVLSADLLILKPSPGSGPPAGKLTLGASGTPPYALPSGIVQMPLQSRRCGCVT